VIYTHIGLSTTIRVVTLPWSSENSREDAKDLNFQRPNLLNTCKQVRQEATTLLCKYAVFDLAGFHTRLLLTTRHNQEFFKFVTSIRISTEFASCQSYLHPFALATSGEYKPLTMWLPNLERVYVESKGWTEGKWRGRTRANLRSRCENDTLEVIFSGE